MFRHNIQTALVTGESHRAAVLSLSGNDHKLFRWLSYNTWNWYKKNSIRDNVILSEVVKCKNNIQNVRFQRHQFQVKVFGMIPFFLASQKLAFHFSCGCFTDIFIYGNWQQRRDRARTEVKGHDCQSRLPSHTIKLSQRHLLQEHGKHLLQSINNLQPLGIEVQTGELWITTMTEGSIWSSMSGDSNLYNSTCGKCLLYFVRILTSLKAKFNVYLADCRDRSKCHWVRKKSDWNIYPSSDCLYL